MFISLFSFLNPFSIRTVVYATHIFDGLDDWATHIGFISNNTLAKFGQTTSDFPDLLAHQKNGTVAPLLRTIEGWLRTERQAKKSKGIKVTEEAEMAKDELRGPAGNGYLSGRFNNGFN
jgi:CCR4-NOT complex subunit CAF16